MEVSGGLITGSRVSVTPLGPFTLPAETSLRQSGLTAEVFSSAARKKTRQSVTQASFSTPEPGSFRMAKSFPIRKPDRRNPCST
ncbi:MAG: hypothetical protein E7028_02310 [Planctomycetaceae bacterium]|nr:hypothetical protein [Planctomycetaceae bacterium]